MRLPKFCRTCDTEDAGSLYKLSALSNNYPDRMLSELLSDLTKIESSGASSEKMPQTICDNCRHKLYNAYEFVVQAREAYELLMGHRLEVGFKENNVCLQSFHTQLRNEHDKFKDISADIQCNTSRLETFEIINADIGEYDEKILESDLLCYHNKDPLVLNTRELTWDNIDPLVGNISANENSESIFYHQEMHQSNLTNTMQINTATLDPLVVDAQHLCTSPFSNFIQITAESLNHVVKDIQSPFSFYQLTDQSIPLSNTEINDSGSDPLLMDVNDLEQDQIKFMQYPQTDENSNTDTNDIPVVGMNDDKQNEITAQKDLETTTDEICNQNRKKLLTKIDFYDNRKKDNMSKDEEAQQKLIQNSSVPSMIGVKNLCKRRDVQEVDINMCKPHGLKLIQCMICQNTYRKISELRSHLNDHPVINSTQHKQVDSSELINLLYPDLKKLSSLQVYDRIAKDLTAGNYTRFYSITNQCGYELDLYSSETESETEEKSNVAVKYKRNYVCELCQQNYGRKHQLYEHQRLQHPWSEALHICRRCNARFVSRQLLNHHYITQCKNTSKRYVCRHCPLRFYWKNNFKAHTKSHKNVNQTFACVVCGRSFAEQKSLSVHLLSVHADEDQLVPCLWCSRKFYRRDFMIKHLRRHGLTEQDLPLAETLLVATSKPHGLKDITCKICEIQFESIAELRLHIQIEEKLCGSMHFPYESRQNYSITNEFGFELDLDDSETDDEITVPTLYTCDLCHIQCQRKFELMEHQRTMHNFDKMPYECEHCIFKCVSKNVMDHHKLDQCLNEEKRYVCPKCNYKFMWPENQQQHILLHHEGYGESTKKQPVCETSKFLQCPHCDRTYLLRTRLNNHIRNIHLNDNNKLKISAKKFLCSLCGKEMTSRASLVIHMRRHAGEKPFKCDLCEMAFPRHAELVYHQRIHTGEKPFECTICAKRFAYSHKLKRHTITHSSLKLHKCTYCNKSYRHSKDLNMHLKLHTGKQSFVCETCGESFILSSTLEKHRMMRRHFVDTV